jgi:hypothetical protein
MVMKLVYSSCLIVRSTTYRISVYRLFYSILYNVYALNELLTSALCTKKLSRNLYTVHNRISMAMNRSLCMEVGRKVWPPGGVLLP